MRNTKYYGYSLALSLLLSEYSLADTTITISGGSYNYDLTSTKKVTGDNIKLYDNYYSALIEFSLGSLSLDKTIGEYEKKNFNRINYKTAPLMFKIDNPYAVIFLPTIDIKKYNEPNRKFEEKTLSTWLGFLSFSIKDDNANNISIKSKRYGLTTSLFSEEMRVLQNYAYNNPNSVKNNEYKKQNNRESCKTHFWYTGGTAYCKKDNFLFYGYYGLAYDYYKIDVEHQNLGNGTGTGITYGINAIVEVRYEIAKNNNIVFGIDTSNYKGTETITFNDNKIEDDITRKNTNISLKFISHFR
jgi:hypothetical protein